MRISDWSSDVCSSDLDRLVDREADGEGDDERVDHHRHRADDLRDELVGVGDVEQARLRGERGETDESRQRGVEEKSASVRVDIGGWRIIQKNNVYILRRTHM